MKSVAYGELDLLPRSTRLRYGRELGLILLERAQAVDREGIVDNVSDVAK